MAARKDAEREDAGKTGAKPGGRVVNAPVTPNNGGFENRTALARPEAFRMAGHNNGGFETRAAQEQGTH